MAGALLSVILAAQDVWVATEGLPEAHSPDAACTTETFAAALRAHRPNVAVHPWDRQRPPSAGEVPPPRALRVRLAQHGDALALEVDGAGRAIQRTLPATDDCERDLQTAALIVDGALDELGVSPEAPTLDLAPAIPFRKQLHLSASVGAGAGQGVFGFVPAFDVQGAVRYRFAEVTLDVDFGLASTTPFSVTPEAGSGSLSATALAVEVGAGLAPRLGPGRLTVDAVVGVELTFVSVASNALVEQPTATTNALFKESPQTSQEPFGGLRLGYSVDLSWGFFVQARAEERVAHAATFEVVGAKFGDFGGSSTIVTTPVLMFQGLGLLGLHFF